MKPEARPIHNDSRELAEDLKQRLLRLLPIFESEPEVLAVYLFGSQVDGYAMPWSDIDLAVLSAEPISLSAQLGLEAEISVALGTDEVDMVDLRRMPLELQHRVISSGHLLYEREPERVSDFIETTILRYFDFRHVLETYHREFAESLDQDYAT